MKSDPTVWIAVRSLGFAAYALLGASVLGGLVLRAKPLGRRLTAASVAEVHKTLALLAVAATAAHGLLLLLDRAVRIPLEALVVPGLSPYRPLWVGAGVAAAWLVVLVTASFWARKWIGVRAWRGLHYASYAAFLLATAHGLAAGTDSGQPWAIALYGAMSGAVIGLTAWRAVGAPRRPRRATAPRAA